MGTSTVSSPQGCSVTDSDTRTEFDFIPAQAQALGLVGPPPQVRRLIHRLDSGRVISALQYGDEPPVVTFLHGAGLNAHTFDTTVLAMGTPALSIDLPGHGDSSWRDDVNYAPRAMADDVAAAIAAWTSTPQVLVGQSLGGLTASVIAARHPALVRTLVLVDITPGFDQAGVGQVRGFLDGATDFASRDEIVERAISFGLGGDRASTERGVFLNTRVREDGRVVFKHHFANLGGLPSGGGQTDVLSSLWEELDAVTAPIALIRGDHGYVTEANGATFVERLPGSALFTIEAGHNVQEDAPAELGDVLAGLIRPTMTL